eukprot:8985335-Pyramimonas_sp.AAC.1
MLALASQEDSTPSTLSACVQSRPVPIQDHNRKQGPAMFGEKQVANQPESKKGGGDKATDTDLAIAPAGGTELKDDAADGRGRHRP